MPEVRIDVLNNTAKSLEEISEHLAKVQKELRYLLGGNIDADNIIAKSITAQLIQVDELSAITANMGKLTSGEIYGAYIATKEIGYPRVELSSDNNLFRVMFTDTSYVEIMPNLVSSGQPTPAIRFVQGGKTMSVGYNVATSGEMGIATNDYLTMYSPLTTNFPGRVKFLDWSYVSSELASRTLQQELNAIWNAIDALTP